MSMHWGEEKGHILYQNITLIYFFFKSNNVMKDVSVLTDYD